MGELLDQSGLGELPAVRSWLCHADSTQRIIEEDYGNVTEPAAPLMVTVQENVLVKLENLRTHPAVAEATSRNKLELQGWVYEFETGQVFSHHPDARQFAPIDGASLGD